MSTKPRPNLLLCYEQIPESTDIYFVPSTSDLPINLLNALLRLNDVVVNHTEKSPVDEKQWRDVCYLQAATYTDRSYLSEENEYNQNRFFALLEPFRLDPSKPGILPVDGNLMVIRTAFLL